MAPISEAAAGADPRFVTRAVSGLDIVFRVTAAGERMVLPAQGGLREQML